jgi:hypothetical protein
MTGCMATPVSSPFFYSLLSVSARRRWIANVRSVQRVFVLCLQAGFLHGDHAVSQQIL